MVSIYTITSELHDEQSVAHVTAEFLGSLGIEYSLKGADFGDYGADDLSLIYVRTGGTENVFKSVLQKVLGSRQPVYLLTSGKSNSLAASMEILSFLRQNGIKGEIIHGNPSYIKSRVESLLRIEKARKTLYGKRVGVVGKPSDWLISSAADYAAVKEKAGIEIIDIDIKELVEEIGKVSVDRECVMEACGCQILSAAENVQASAEMATAIYHALKALVAKYSLSGLTLRCFDLLTAVRNTGCLALAKLNSEGIVSSCEGDIPTLLSMLIADAIAGVSGFQANPSRINPETGEVVFAHCTIPFNMVESFVYDTHFESGIGVGIRGKVAEGPVTVFKVSGNLGRCFAEEGSLLRNLCESDLCRTQVVLNLDSTDYFLKNPIGNHHVIIPGHCADELTGLLDL
ncbi:MAG: hypothetical protein NC308_10795 [Clostridium sp.]|nr:hypothetical protein [Bacteroides sp.]MCM1199362.1 hypothetical protein [Clostridium sp.]